MLSVTGVPLSPSGNGYFSPCLVSCLSHTESSGVSSACDRVDDDVSISKHREGWDRSCSLFRDDGRHKLGLLRISPCLSVPTKLLLTSLAQWLLQITLPWFVAILVAWFILTGGNTLRWRRCLGFFEDGSFFDVALLAEDGFGVPLGSLSLFWGRRMAVAGFLFDESFSGVVFLSVICGCSTAVSVDLVVGLGGENPGGVSYL